MMSMLTRTGTIVRKHRRRSIGRVNSRRGSAPTVLQPSSQPGLLRVGSGKKPYLTPQPSPSKSVTFTFESNEKPPLHSSSLQAVEEGVSRQYRRASVTSRRDSQSVHAPEKVTYGTTVYWSEPISSEQSYSFFASLTEAFSEASGTCDFIGRGFSILSGTWIVNVFLGVLLLLPLLMTAIGLKYLDECPKEPKIPIYLLVGGCFGMLRLVLLLWRQIRVLRHDYMDDFTVGDELLTVTRVTNWSLNLFLAVWFVLGNHWLFTTREPHFSAPLHEPRNWCARTVFTFTFWQLITCHILLGTVVLVAAIFLVSYRCYKIWKMDKG